MRHLLWKEWHEQSWKLGFGSIVLGALAFIGMRSRIAADQIMMMWVCLLGLTLLPVLSSAGLVAAERGEGTLETLVALPVKTARILHAKLTMGLILCAGPMLVAMILSLLAAGGREMPACAMIAFYAGSTVTTLSLFIWMLALTIRLPSETRAALLSVGILILWMLITEGLAYPSVPRWAMVVSPFALVYQVVGDGPDDSRSWISLSSLSAEMMYFAVALSAQFVIAFFLLKYAAKRIED